MDVNRFKRAAPDQAMSAYWSKADLRWKRGRRLVLNIHSSHTGRQRVALRGVVPPLTMPKLLAASARRLMRI